MNHRHPGRRRSDGRWDMDMAWYLADHGLNAMRDWQGADGADVLVTATAYSDPTKPPLPRHPSAAGRQRAKELAAAEATTAKAIHAKMVADDQKAERARRRREAERDRERRREEDRRVAAYIEHSNRLYEVRAAREREARRIAAEAERARQARRPVITAESAVDGWHRWVGTVCTIPFVAVAHLTETGMIEVAVDIDTFGRPFYTYTSNAALLRSEWIIDVVEEAHLQGALTA